MSIFLILLSLAIWGVIHSILASHFAKDMLKGFFGRLYRLGYNVFAVVSFAPILYLAATLPDAPVYRVPAPWSFVMMGIQLLSALLLLIALLQTDTLSFVGLRQLFEEEKPERLITRGLYKLIRHPLYTFSLMFVWFTPTMSRNSLTLYVGVTLYLFVGAYFEERKLLREYGEDYAEYKRKTPMMIPGLVLSRKN
ncbi:MAG: isoprenylcysteine carboxylmethyltransferase family protein [Anaerolineales bacterium]|nr:isoprenylcysteine carboxylmethyltransferase family protein [Anaerolineales bacterium]